MNLLKNGKEELGIDFDVVFGCFEWLYHSKENIYTSKVRYIIKRGKPYIWVPEHELHNVVCFSC